MWKLLTLIVLAHVNHASSCAEFIIESKDEDKSLIVGRTMEFAVSFSTKIVSSPAKGTLSGQLPKSCGNKQPLTWDNRFKTIYAIWSSDQIEDVEKLWIDGQNEAGLSAAALYFEGLAYYPSEVQNCENAISHAQFVNYILTNFATVAEVNKTLNDGTFPEVWGRPLKVEFETGPEDFIFPIHWSIVDKSGDAIVIEYTEKEGRRVFTNQVGVFTNNPTYDWHTTNLNNYINVQREGFLPKTYTRSGQEYTIKSFGHGSGFLGLPGDFTPPSRFVRTAAMVRFSGDAKSANDAALKAWHIINSNEITINAVDDFTLWTLVKDLTNNIMYWRGSSYVSIRKIDMQKTSNDIAEYIDLDGPFEDSIQDSSRELNPFQPSRNKAEL